MFTRAVDSRPLPDHLAGGEIAAMALIYSIGAGNNESSCRRTTKCDGPTRVDGISAQIGHLTRGVLRLQVADECGGADEHPTSECHCHLCDS